MSFYRKIHGMFSVSGEKGEYSAGAWQAMVRRRALALCAGGNGRLLEIGCGEGLFLAQVRERAPGIKLFGIDISEARVKAAGERLGSADGLSVQDGGRLSFPDNYFDTVVCINVLFNLESPQAVGAVMKEMCRISRPGAKIIFDFRNGGNPLLRLKYAMAPWYDPSVRGLPLRTYTLAEVRRFLSAAGLAAGKVCPLGFPWRMLAPVILVEAGK